MAVASGASHAAPSSAAACPAVPPTTWGVARNQNTPDNPSSARQPPVTCIAQPAAASSDQPASRSSAAATQGHPARMAHTSSGNTCHRGNDESRPGRQRACFSPEPVPTIVAPGQQEVARRNAQKEGNRGQDAAFGSGCGGLVVQASVLGDSRYG